MLRRTVAAAALLAMAPAASAQEHVHGGHDSGQHEHGTASAPMPILKGFGSWSMKVTAQPVARQYFDQGLAMAYGFTHDEAARSFREGLKIDPSCAMCAWGIAYALSPNINMPMSAEAEEQASAAIATAQSLSGRVTPRERDLIDALARRFGQPAGEQRAQRDSAYADAMRALAVKYPRDNDVQVLFADAMMNLSPWNHWTREGTPQPGTLEVVTTLERVLGRTMEHAGACHFYVHAVEASQQPDRALPCAKQLPKLMPAAGHLVHMPAHVYMRVGMYEEAARANIAAMQADHDLFAAHEVTPGVYPMFYAQHNVHFLWAAYMMSGQQAKSLDAARSLSVRIPLDNARAAESLESLISSTILTHVRFGDWKAALNEPLPAADLLFVKANWHYARGVAHAALGDLVNAQAELDSLAAVTGQISPDMIIILNPAHAVLKVADLVLRGRIAAAAGDVDDAVRLLREAVAAEDELTYDEPPAWYHPVRQVLGTVLLNAQRAAEAEEVFRDDLRSVRENGWSLSGLERALRAQGRTAEAAQVSRRLADAWKHADVVPATSVQRVSFHSVQLPTGVKMRYAEAGPREGEAVVFLHGYSDSWFSWSQVLAGLPDGVRAIAVDLRGHGMTEYGGTDYSMKALGDDVAALMDRIGIIRATIVGHSLGAIVAQAVAVEHAPRVNRLVLVAPAASSDVAVIAELREAVYAQADPMPMEFIREFQLSTIHAPVPASFLERVMVESSRLRTAAWRGLADSLGNFDFTGELKSARIPTWILAGDSDAVFPLPVQQQLAEKLNAELIVYEDTGHALQWERPDRFVGELLGVISSGVAQR